MKKKNLSKGIKPSVLKIYQIQNNFKYKRFMLGKSCTVIKHSFRYPNIKKRHLIDRFMLQENLNKYKKRIPC